MGKKGDQQQREVDENYKEFKRLLPDLMRTDRGRHALMHNKKVIACFDTRGDARRAGKTLVKGNFSIQKITTKPIDLGFFSHAIVGREV
jgi:hypothetical protein